MERPTTRTDARRLAGDAGEIRDLWRDLLSGGNGGGLAVLGGLESLLDRIEARGGPR